MTDTYTDPASASTSSLWGAYERLREASNEALNAGDMDTYRRVDKQESAVTAEIDRRSTAGTSLDGPTSKAIPGDAGRVIASRRQELAAARAEAARLGDVQPPRPGAPPPPGKTVKDMEVEYRAAVEAKLEAGAIAEEIATLEKRAAWFTLSDDMLRERLEDARIEVERHKADAARFTADKRPRAAQKAQRLAAEVEAASMGLYREEGHRRADRDHEKVIEVMSREKALKARDEGLRHWTRELEEREDMSRRYAAGEPGIPSKWANLGHVIEARKNVEAIREMATQHPKPTPAEIQLQRDIIQAEAPRRRGSWAS
jgi:hypothetical protein